MYSEMAAAAQAVGGAVSQAGGSVLHKHQESHSEHQKCHGRRQWAPYPCVVSCSCCRSRRRGVHSRRGQNPKCYCKRGSANTVSWPMWGFPSPSTDWHCSALDSPGWSQPFSPGQDTQHQQTHLSALELEVWLQLLGFIALLSPPEKEWKGSGQLYIEFLLPKHSLFGVSS